MATVDSWALATDAGIRYVDTGFPGYRRANRSGSTLRRLLDPAR
ncbi:MAG: hypothetical protein ACRDU9_09345 [Acidimicrobiia bacterium]